MWIDENTDFSPVKDETKEYENDEIIPEEAIESYFVWIPKYSYQLFNLGKYTSEETLTEATQVINRVKVKFSQGTKLFSFLLIK